MMLAAKGAIRASGAGLPYDAEVEYLESSGTQYIDTGIKPGPNTRVEITFAMTTFTANCGLFGARGTASADNNSYNLFIISNSGARVRWDWSGSGQYQTTEAETSTVATYVLGAAGGSITRDGTTVMSVSASKAAINYPLYVFNMNNVGTLFSTGANARVWSVKIYDGQTLVFDAIPVRKKTMGYLYDRVSGKLFGNKGSGDFVLGPDVVPVEYIESHGTEWIDTGLAAQRFLQISIDAQMFAPMDTSVRFGGVGANWNTQHRFYINSSGVGGYAIGGSNQALTGFNPLERFKLSYSLPSATVTVDGVGVMQFAWNFTGPNPNYTLFALNNNGTIVPSKWRKYSFDASIYNSDTKISLRPVRVGTEGAMIDTLTRRIYRNAGSGAFTYGNDLKYPIPA